MTFYCHGTSTDYGNLMQQWFADYGGAFGAATFRSWLAGVGTTPELRLMPTQVEQTADIWKINCRVLKHLSQDAFNQCNC